MFFVHFAKPGRGGTGSYRFGLNLGGCRSGVVIVAIGSALVRPGATTSRSSDTWGTIAGGGGDGRDTCAAIEQCGNGREIIAQGVEGECGRLETKIKALDACMDMVGKK